MAHILVICTANICRSPVAKVILQDRLKRRGLDNWTVSSAGTWAMTERAASHNSQIVMAEYGLDISDHLARMVQASYLEEADLVLCMEEGHVEALTIEFPDQAHKIYLLSSMGGKTFSISDPYGQSLIEYQRMAAEIASIIDYGMDRIVELAEENSGE